MATDGISIISRSTSYLLFLNAGAIFRVCVESYTVLSLFFLNLCAYEQDNQQGNATLCANTVYTRLKR